MAPVMPPTPPATKCFHPAALRFVAGSFLPSFVGPEYAEVAVAGPSGEAAVAVDTEAILCFVLESVEFGGED